MRGWSVNLTEPRVAPQWVDLGTPVLFQARSGPVVEVIFWSAEMERWVHGVAGYAERKLPPGHVQVTLGDMWWMDQLEARYGDRAAVVRYVTDVLDRYPVPED